ncbi:HEAT repeat domain-containing protein [Sphingobacterium faecium]|uniref:HEAT repeat domain-containing protein n=1 Tax=Sphingobacterium faecium TaxID=34087 RepID=UPI003DA5A0E8
MAHQITLNELVIAIIIVFMMVMVMIIAVLLYSLYQYRILHNRQIWTRIIENKIIESIVGGHQAIADDQSFNSNLRKYAFRDLFLGLLVTSERKFSGAARQEISFLFHQYHLEKEAWKNLKKKKNYLVVAGIQELSAMGVTRALSVFTSLLKHSDRLIYQEAQYAVLTFKGFEGLSFLNTLHSPLSDWQQLRLLHSITEIPDSHDLSPALWLESSNITVIIFTFRLIRKFQLLTFYNAVLKLLDHDHVHVRKEAVRTLESLENDDTVHQLTTSFPQQPLSVQLEILKALKRSKSMECLAFLKQQFLEHPDNAIKIAAAEVMVCLGQEQYLTDMALDSNTALRFKQIVNHALQKKIC